MGKQSSRLIYRGKDIKDLVYQGNFLNKLYKGNDLVWEKLYRYFVRNTSLVVFDLDGKKYISEYSGYSISELKKSTTYAIAVLWENKNNRYFFAISYDMLQWKEIKELEHKTRINGKSVYYYFMASYNGFFVYEYAGGNNNEKLYFVEIDYGLEYTVKEVYSPDVFWRNFSQYGVSDYFYGIQKDKAKEYILHRIWENGTVESKQLMGNFIKDNVGMDDEGIQILADGNGNAFLICPNVGASNGGTAIFKVQNMDTDNIYTAFWARTSKILNGSVCDIDILYDSYQTLFLAHRGFSEEKEFVEGRSGRSGYYNMEFYVIDSSGNVIPTLQERDKEINIKCYEMPDRDYLTIKFGGRKDTGDDYKTPTTEGIIYFYNIKKGISSSRTELDLNSVIFDYNKMQNDTVFVGEYSWTDYYNYVPKQRTVVIFIDNLYMNESDGNFIAVTRWDE